MDPYVASFGVLAAAMGGLAWVVIDGQTTWYPYVVWVASLSITTFAFYGLDKTLSRLRAPRAPEVLLHVLALLGGFAGGWLGRAIFHHKTNARRHPLFVWVLVLSTIGHGGLVYYWFLRGQ